MVLTVCGLLLAATGPARLVGTVTTGQVFVFAAVGGLFLAAILQELWFFLRRPCRGFASFVYDWEAEEDFPRACGCGLGYSCLACSPEED